MLLLVQHSFILLRPFSVTQGTDKDAVSLMDLRQDTWFQTSSIMMYCLMPTYDAEAASAAGLNAKQIKQGKMEVLQACVSVFVPYIN
jgi:hypothetical protein